MKNPVLNEQFVKISGLEFIFNLGTGDSTSEISRIYRARGAMGDSLMECVAPFVDEKEGVFLGLKPDRGVLSVTDFMGSARFPTFLSFYNFDRDVVISAGVFGSVSGSGAYIGVFGDDKVGKEIVDRVAGDFSKVEYHPDGQRNVKTYFSDVSRAKILEKKVFTGEFILDSEKRYDACSCGGDICSNIGLYLHDEVLFNYLSKAGTPLFPDKGNAAAWIGGSNENRVNAFYHNDGVVVRTSRNMSHYDHWHDKEFDNICNVGYRVIGDKDSVGKVEKVFGDISGVLDKAIWEKYERFSVPSELDSVKRKAISAMRC